MPFVRRHRQWGLIGLLVCLLLVSHPGKAQEATTALPSQCDEEKDDALVGGVHLKCNSYDIAKMVCPKHDPARCASDLIAALGKLPDRCETDATKALLLRQEISEMILTASLQVDGFLAEIDSETGQIRAVRDRLASQRDSALGKSAWGSAIGTSGGAVGSALALGSEAAATAGSWVGAVFGGAGALFSILPLLQQSGPTGCFPDLRDPKEKDTCEKLVKKQPLECDSWDPRQYDDADDPCRKDSKSQPIGCSPRMLYELLCAAQAGEAEKKVEDKAASSKDRQSVRDWWFHSLYDEPIKKYLNDTWADHEKNWSTTLVDRWTAEDPLTETLITGNMDPRKLNIDALNDRANKLADLRTVVARLNRDLSRLTEDLANGLRCPLP